MKWSNEKLNVLLEAQKAFASEFDLGRLRALGKSNMPHPLLHFVDDFHTRHL